MRSLQAFALLSALAVAACSSPCQDLGDRLCSCAGSSSASDACKRQVKSELDRHSPGDSFCSAKLDTCTPPSDAVFCDWIQTDCGKASCGLSDEPIHATSDGTPGACDPPAPTP
jgi:hypothetical protein